MAKHVGPDEAFEILLDNMPDDEEQLCEALRPLFQSALLVAAEVLHRRDERERYWKARGK